MAVAVSTVTHGAPLQRESAQTDRHRHTHTHTHTHTYTHSHSHTHSHTNTHFLLSQHCSLCSPDSSCHPGWWDAHTQSEETVCVQYVGYREGGGGGRVECVCVCVCVYVCVCMYVWVSEWVSEHVVGSLKMRALTEQCSSSAADSLLYLRFNTSKPGKTFFFIQRLVNVEYKPWISIRTICE